eukprot:TRINITY_DN7711_c0_g1_i13.p2 TRINITY_DN7711_c0_g1~~TRINITY_DN7711_c0_g1_i13.p2  ORF type:complete len:227 (-),score=75.17 TRINITY_DN7711_c0_g1_i13:61-741(-)
MCIRDREYVEKFKHEGVHGVHYCTAFEVMGPSLYDLILHYDNYDKGIPINEVKVITRQLLIGLDYMHRICNIIHTDLKPENIMIHLEDDELKQFVENLHQVKKKPLSMKFLSSMKLKNKKEKRLKIQQDKQKNKRKLLSDKDHYEDDETHQHDHKVSNTEHGKRNQQEDYEDEYDDQEDEYDQEEDSDQEGDEEEEDEENEEDEDEEEEEDDDKQSQDLDLSLIHI